MVLNLLMWFWGDVLLFEGCDGGVVMFVMDGSGVVIGFSWNIFREVLEGVLVRKVNGSFVLGKIVGFEVNEEVMRWEFKVLDLLREVFIVEDVKLVIVMENGRWDLIFYVGIYWWWGFIRFCLGVYDFEWGWEVGWCIKRWGFG